jgi:pyridoxine 4-dehydrogenase
MATAEHGIAARSGTFTLGDNRPVYRLGFGAMRVTGPGIWGAPKDIPQAVRVLKHAVELGINFIDTADSYGPYVSEELLAKALHPYPEGLVIATKGGLVRPGANRWDPDGRPAHLKEACEGSLRRLKLDRIPLYQLHAPDPKVPYAESVGALAELQQAGKIEHIGVSNVRVSELERARGVVRVASVQNRYNLFDRHSEDVLEYCTRNGIGFIPWYPLATGDLSDRTGGLQRVAERLGATPAQVALAWLLRRSPVMLPIPGTSTIGHLDENTRAAALELSDEDLANLAPQK